MMIQKLITSIEAKHKDEPLTQENFDSWRHNPVTQRLLEELEVKHMELQLSDISLTGDATRTGIMALCDQSTKLTLETVINWKPTEIEAELEGIETDED